MEKRILDFLNKADNTIYQNNLDLFIQKNPKYTFFLPRNFKDKSFILTLKEIQKYQKDIQALKAIDKAEIIYVYGLEQGLAYFLLRKRLKKKKLIFLENDKKALIDFLASKSAMTILQDPSVQVCFNLEYPQDDFFVDDLAKKNFCFGKMEFLTSNFLSPTQKRYFEKLKHKILSAKTYFRALYIDDLYSYLHFPHFLKNIEKLPQSFHLNKLKGLFKNVPAIICGAGPSLYKERKFLKTLKNKALIIAGGSAITAFSSYGIKPHLGVVIDPNLEEEERMKKVTFFDLPIIYSTRVHSGVFKYLKGEIGYMSSTAGGIESFFLEKELKIEAKELIGQNLSREALSVTTMNIELAHFLGCSPLILCGVDLSFDKKKRYSPGIVEKNHKMVFQAEDPGDMLIKKKNKITLIKWAMEAKAISSYKEKFNLSIINTSKKGLGFKNIEYQPLKSLKFKDQEDLEKTFQKAYKEAFLSITKKEITLFKKRVKKSLETCKTILSKMKKENQNIFSSLLQKDLEQELAYKYFLQRPKEALKDCLNNKEEISLNSKTSALPKTVESLWDNLEKITDMYLKGFLN